MDELILELRKAANPEKAKTLQRFFKTGKGEYAEGDVFLGISMPEQRRIAKAHREKLSMKDIQKLLDSSIHEHRSVAMITLVDKYKKAKKDKFKQLEIYEFYLKNTHRINNWDLVDISAPHIVGNYAMKDGDEIIKFLSKSKNLWEKRIAIVSTQEFIRKKNYGLTLGIADALMNDEHDLIHKAVGWMLREVGKRNKSVLELFLSTRYKNMPRTMLRYAIEKFPEEERQKYLKGEI